MSENATLVGKLEFTSPINKENSFGSWNLAKRTKSIMSLYFYKDTYGFIEWDIPKLEMTEHIGLIFEFDVNGKRTLVDYDGVFELPSQAMRLLEKYGVDVAEIRESLKD